MLHLYRFGDLLGKIIFIEMICLFTRSIKHVIATTHQLKDLDGSDMVA
jgi:hypothetical protein